MDWLTLGAIHDRIRAAMLPGYSLHYAEGPDTYWMKISGHGGQSYVSREHSADILLEWANEILQELGA